MENINSLRHVSGHVGTAELLPDTSAACGHSSRAIQMSGCRVGGDGECSHRNQWWEGQGGQQADNASCRMEVQGDSNNSNSSIMGKKKKASALKCSQRKTQGAFWDDVPA